VGVTDMIRYDVYLAGAMHGRVGEVVLAERLAAKNICKKLGLTYYDPAEDEVIKPNEIIDAKPNLKLMRWYVEKDDKHIDQCRSLLLLTGDKASSGSLWECGRMRYRNHRPIAVVAPLMCAGQLANFTTVKADKLAKTQKAGLIWLKRRLK